MCQDYVEVHKCKHETKTPIPCEGKDNSGTCTAKPEDTQDIITESNFNCPGCQAEEAKQAEDAALAEAMKQIEEDPALAPAPKTANKPAGNFGTVKYRTRWMRCKHCTNPIDSGEARQDADAAEWIDLLEPGNCDNCSLTNPNDLAEMRARGELDCDDPWGALDIKDEPETGGSARPKHPASNIPDNDNDDDEDRGHFAPTRSPSPDQIPTIARGKGKGRASKPGETYASRHGAAEPAVPDYDSDAGHEDDSPLHSGDEGHDGGFKARKGKAPKYALSDDDEDYDDEEDEEDEEEEPTPRGRKVKKHGVGNSSRGSSSKSGTQRHGARDGSSDYSQDEEDGIPDWSSQPPPGGPPPPMASGALRPPLRNPARRNARAAEDDE